MMNIQRSLRGALLAGPAALLLACGDSVTDPRSQRFMGCDVRDIFVGDARSGTLSSGDCRVQNAYTDMYFFDHRNDQDILIIDLESFDFDAFLSIYDWDTGELLYENDDVNDFDTDARLSGTLPRSRYVIAASSFEAGETGQYVLTVD
ncbi:MAG: hypothetical protein ACSLFE_02535 [Gemmatimonadaceae bacterium]